MTKNFNLVFKILIVMVCLMSTLIILPKLNGKSELTIEKTHASNCVDDAGQIKLAKPTALQLAFMDMEVGAFFHYDLNVFTGEEHGTGFASPSEFNPTKLDMDQWLRTAKALGAKYAVLTARHEGGFCLWPSKTTDYTIANSPYKDGKGDLVREYIDACHKYDIKVGIYFTASHDAHHTFNPGDKGKVPWGPVGDAVRQKNFKTIGEMGRQKYIALQVEQMRELMTRYGELTYIWCDHWNGGKATEDAGAWTRASREAWRQITRLMRELQPNCTMMGPDVCTPGNEKGLVVYPMWNAINTRDGSVMSRSAITHADATVPNDYGLLETTAATGHPLGKYWRSRECPTNTGFHYGGWFWHPPYIQKTYARTLPEHLNLYYRTVGLGANIIINLPPDQRGLIPDDITRAAEVFGKEISRRFANPIAQIDDVQKGNAVELSWSMPREINTVVLMENIVNGQKIAKYILEAYIDGTWKPLQPMNRLAGSKPYNNNPGFETIGHKKIDRVIPVTTNRIRFRCLESVMSPVEIRSMAVYKCVPIDQATGF